MPRLPLVLNPASGRHASDPAALAAAFRDAGVEVDVRATGAGDIAREVRAAVERGDPVVAVAGGDGTLRSAAQVLAGTRTALLPVPAGTLNHFSRRMGIETAADAVKAAAEGRTVSVTLGMAGEEVFLNTVTCGLYAPVIRRREKLRARWGKWVAAGIAMWSTLRTRPPADVAVDADDAAWPGPFLLAWGGIGRCSFPQAWNAEGDDTIELVLVRPGAGRGALRGIPWVHLVQAARESATRDPDGRVVVLQVGEFRLRSPRTLDVTLDGEAMRMAAPLEVGVRPDALRVVVPAAHDRAGSTESTRSRDR